MIGNRWGPPHCCGTTTQLARPSERDLLADPLRRAARQRRRQAAPRARVRRRREPQQHRGERLTWPPTCSACPRSGDADRSTARISRPAQGAAIAGGDPALIVNMRSARHLSSRLTDRPKGWRALVSQHSPPRAWRTPPVHCGRAPHKFGEGGPENGPDGSGACELIPGEQ